MAEKRVTFTNDCNKRRDLLMDLASSPTATLETDIKLEGT